MQKVEPYHQLHGVVFPRREEAGHHPGLSSRGPEDKALTQRGLGSSIKIWCGERGQEHRKSSTLDGFYFGGMIFLPDPITWTMWPGSSKTASFISQHLPILECHRLKHFCSRL